MDSATTAMVQAFHGAVPANILCLMHEYARVPTHVLGDCFRAVPTVNTDDVRHQIGTFGFQKRRAILTQYPSSLMLILIAENELRI